MIFLPIRPTSPGDLLRQHLRAVRSGYTLVFGVLDILNLAHAAIFMMGAMFSWWLVTGAGLASLARLPGRCPARRIARRPPDRVAFLRLRRRGAGHLSPLIIIHRHGPDLRRGRPPPLQPRP